jgi:hypothetical protein
MQLQFGAQPIWCRQRPGFQRADVCLKGQDKFLPLLRAWDSTARLLPDRRRHRPAPVAV